MIKAEGRLAENNPVLNRYVVKAGFTALSWLTSLPLGPSPMFTSQTSEDRSLPSGTEDLNIAPLPIPLQPQPSLPP